MIATLLIVLAGAAEGQRLPVQAPEPRARPGLVVLAAERALRAEARAGVLALALGPAPGARDATRAGLAHEEDRALAEALRAASAIELAGGTWLGWYGAATHQRRERLWTRALRDAHAAGVPVVARGLAAAWIAERAPVARAELGRPAQIPHDDSPDLSVPGLGLGRAALEGLLVGVLVPGAPGADRVLERAVADGYRGALLLGGEAEVELDAAARQVRFRLGARGWAAWIDLASAQRSRLAVEGARVAFPADGDVLDARRGAWIGIPDAPSGADTRLEAAPLAALLAGQPDPHSAPDRAPDRAPVKAPEMAPRVRALILEHDARSARTPRGGPSGLRLRFDLAPR